MSNQIRVLLTANDEAVLTRLRMVLDSDRDFSIVGEARGVTTTLRLVDASAPDVLILHSKVDTTPFLNIVGQLRWQCPYVKILILGVPANGLSLLDLPREQLCGCISDDADGYEIVAAVKRVASGHKVWDADLVLQSVCASTRTVPMPSTLVRIQAPLRPLACARRTPVLSPRELAVLSLVGGGLNNQRVAEALGIRSGTVRRHLASIYEKLNVHSRTEAVTRAITLGWLQLPASAQPEKSVFLDLRSQTRSAPEPDAAQRNFSPNV